MNYAAMSDFEIDCLVVKHLYQPSEYRIDAAAKKITVVEEVCTGIVMERPYYPTDYWDDAGPILEENGITIIMDHPSMPLATNNCVGWYSDEAKPLHHANENPRRAGLVVFLMMKGGE